MNTHHLPMAHPKGLAAEIVQDEYSGRWRLPGGLAYRNRAQAEKIAIPMFKRAGWKLQEVRK